jgi:hypothetical protein
MRREGNHSEAPKIHDCAARRAPDAAVMAGWYRNSDYPVR